eukprot:9202280-Alexandrium_andersonii.AAC.1
MRPSGAPGTNCLRPFLGPRSSSSEHLKRFASTPLGRAYYGLRWIAALAGLERIADCIADALRCEDPMLGK